MKQIKIDTDLARELESITKKFHTYKQFSHSKKHCYNYTHLIGITVCPYCNINYIPTIYDVTRPELDHFIPQSSTSGKNKILDYNNLVPSCHTCNSTLKGKKIFSKDTHLHPFIDDFDSIMKFSINMTGSNILNVNDFDIVFFPISKDENFVKRAFNNIKDFKLTERYAQHKDIVIKHFRFMEYYNKRKRKEVYDILSCNENSMPLNILLYDFINISINNVSLGKLIKDIYRSYLQWL